MRALWQNLWWIVPLAGLLIAAALSWSAYRSDLGAIEARLESDSRLFALTDGELEYIRWGSGPVVIALHGAGGGYDQGQLLADAFAGDGFDRISISRFGYLRSTLPADASTAAQADGLAALLDDQGVEQTSIIAMSGGVPPALQFAARYPDRTQALVLLSSAPYTPLNDQGQARPMPTWMYQALFSSNFPYWTLARLARGQLAAIFDVSPQLRSALPPRDAAFLDAMIDAFLPVTARLDGVANEGAAIDPQAVYRIDQITAPTLIIHARNDTINAFAIAEHAAAQIEGAELVALADGGHILAGHHEQVRAQVRAFLQAHAER